LPKGKKDIEDNKRPDCPVTIKTDENDEKMMTVVGTDSFVGVRVIAVEINVTRGMVRQKCCE
jgi:hypothetical protein